MRRELSSIPKTRAVVDFFRLSFLVAIRGPERRVSCMGECPLEDIFDCERSKAILM